MSHATSIKLRIAALAALGTSLLAIAAPSLATSPFAASWIWIR